MAASIDAHEVGAPRANPRLSRTSVRILREWFDAHRDSPYPSELDKQHLTSATGLSTKQIGTWFINARRRRKPVATRKSTVSGDGEWDGMNALDRWRNSPPELEPASLTDIAAALDRRGDRGGDSAGSSVHDCRSQDASSSSANSDARSSWAGSVSSGATSNGSDKKRRRRRRARAAHPLDVQAAGGERKFQCTFCTDRFKTKYDWTRHEATQHLSLEKWACTPHGPQIYAPGRQRPLCALCGAEDPSPSHTDAHRYKECAEKPATARTFYRKDHLRQHLQQFHDVDELLPSMMDWRTKITRINCRCGFCQQTFDDWVVRNDHLAGHFRNGSLMKDWTGCRGLDPAVAMMVENAIPPYLIGNESASFNPFSAETRAAQADIDTRQDNEARCPGPTAFQKLVAQLSSFVNKRRTQGALPTDLELQREARLIVYGEDDPWNQTAADNLQWLELFKMGHGLDAAAQFGSTKSTSSTLDCSEDAGFHLPWYWQSPECLAEYRQCQAPFGESPFASNPPGEMPLSDDFSPDAPKCTSICDTGLDRHLTCPQVTHSNLPLESPILPVNDLLDQQSVFSAHEEECPSQQFDMSIEDLLQIDVFDSEN